MRPLIIAEEKPAIRCLLLGSALLLAGIAGMFFFGGYLWLLKSSWLTLPVIVVLTAPLLAGGGYMLTGFILFISARGRI